MDLLLAFAAILLPVAIGAGAIVAGVARGWAPWPWLVGLGVALIPAIYMAGADLCGTLAGACPSGDELSNSRQAIVSVIAFVAAAGSLAIGRSPRRDRAFAALVLFGEVWLVLRLFEAGEPPAAIMVILLIALGIGHEVAARMRARRAPAAA